MAAKTTKKAVVATTEQTPEQLQALLITKQADLLGHRKGLKLGELKNTAVIKSTRKEIARIKTVLSVKMATKEGEK